MLTFLAIFELWHMLRDIYRIRNCRLVAQDHHRPSMIQRVHFFRCGTTLAVELYHSLVFLVQFVPIILFVTLITLQFHFILFILFIDCLFGFQFLIYFLI